jgi:hypothetical protein
MTALDATGSDPVALESELTRRGGKRNPVVRRYPQCHPLARMLRFEVIDPGLHQRLYELNR